MTDNDNDNNTDLIGGASSELDYVFVQFENFGDDDDDYEARNDYDMDIKVGECPCGCDNDFIVITMEGCRGVVDARRRSPDTIEMAISGKQAKTMIQNLKGELVAEGL